MKKNIAAGNWKLNKTKKECIEYLTNFSKLPKNPNVQIILAPSAPFMDICIESKSKLNMDVDIYSQNVSKFSNGSFTGEISAKQLSSIGVKGSIIAHSERRKYFNESNEDANKKIQQCLENNLNCIYCIGESIEERKNQTYLQSIKSQLVNGLANIDLDKKNNIIIAYEPVWAIGTGETADSNQINEVHNYISEILINLKLNDLPTLYGGSVNETNHQEIMNIDNVSGVLVGSASLKAEKFHIIGS